MKFPQLNAWMAFAIGSAFFAGLTVVFAKIGVEKIPSNLATLLRTAVVVLLLSMVISVRNEWQNPLQLPLKSLLFILLSGIATGLSWMCYYRALQMGPASLVAPIDKLSLVIAIVLSVAFLAERLNYVQWIGTGLILIGTWLVTNYAHPGR